MKYASPHPGSAGFTLLELMVVVAVAAVLAAIAAPSFSTFIDNQRLRNASFDIVSDLSLARSEALTRQTTVVITPGESHEDFAGAAAVLSGQQASEALSVHGCRRMLLGSQRLSA